MKRFASLTILIMVFVILFLNSCKKDRQQGNQNPPGTSQNRRELIIKNLSWSYDSAAKKAFVNVAIPSNYSVDSISTVYWLFIYFNKWNNVLKDGTGTDRLCYSIVNGGLMLYYIFEINDPRTDVQYLIKNLNESYHTIKIDFI